MESTTGEVTHLPSVVVWNILLNSPNIDIERNLWFTQDGSVYVDVGRSRCRTSCNYIYGKENGCRSNPRHQTRGRKAHPQIAQLHRLCPTSIDTRYNLPTVSSERHWQIGVKRNCPSSKAAPSGVKPRIHPSSMSGRRLFWGYANR